MAKQQCRDTTRVTAPFPNSIPSVIVSLYLVLRTFSPFQHYAIWGLGDPDLIRCSICVWDHNKDYARLTRICFFGKRGMFGRSLVATAHNCIILSFLAANTSSLELWGVACLGFCVFVLGLLLHALACQEEGTRGFRLRFFWKLPGLSRGSGPGLSDFGWCKEVFSFSDITGWLSALGAVCEALAVRSKMKRLGNTKTRITVQHYSCR